MNRKPLYILACVSLIANYITAPVSQGELSATKPQAMALPPRMDIGKIAATYPAGNSDVIAEILAGAE